MSVVDKIKSQDELAEIIRREQDAGKKVVFTNGCFDLIHVGHTRYLKTAREKGDLLVVALNSDESIRQLKGDRRPLLPLNERLRILASFWMVDFVTWFDELDPWNCINKLRPNVLVKGGNYKINEIVGRDIVWALGGEVIAAPLFPGKSTSDIIQEIVERFSQKQNSIRR
ncbi:adenylyltransferase/cytidyltransferase family protein [Candidatus Sumerlaeota bacterium]|nr:adenylyltransferase/cytidyltransferase family protein [Candidatus Sumerlaeota bacterium]